MAALDHIRSAGYEVETWSLRYYTEVVQADIDLETEWDVVPVGSRCEEGDFMVTSEGLVPLQPTARGSMIERTTVVILRSKPADMRFGGVPLLTERRWSACGHTREYGAARCSVCAVLGWLVES